MNKAFLRGAPATVLFLPGALAYTWLGYAGREALAGGDLIRNLLVALALLSAVAFLPRFVRKLREKPMLSVVTLAE